MKSFICLFACVAIASAQILLEDDGQWRPELDGSALGSGIDGQWNPLADGSLAGISPNPLITPVVHVLKKRSVLATPWAAGVINPNALNVPLDTVHVAAAKNAQLISQATEGTRNILGGGIPLALPADTPEVAAGKAAHAIAHETQKAATLSGHGILAAPGVVAGRALLAGHGLIAPHGLVAPHSLLAARSWLW
ncbi:hypothetical protein O3M35_012203 [Rhynocoris fuscipes]|uniref:Uncharacterized protein n=1 Tax=Rhynocoris fuscipes TaxID=488301 RepID=A0AAW1CUS6_9HEMI